MSERPCCDFWMHATPVGLDPSHPIQPLEIHALLQRHRPNSIHSCLEHRDGRFRACLPTICKRGWTMRARTSRHSRPNPCRMTPNSIPGTEISLVIGECEQWPPKPVLHRLLSFAQLRFHGLGGGKFPISVWLGAQSTRVQLASLLVGCTTSRTRYG